MPCRCSNVYTSPSVSGYSVNLVEMRSHRLYEHAASPLSRLRAEETEGNGDVYGERGLLLTAT